MAPKEEVQMKRLSWDEALTLLSPHMYALVCTLDKAERPNLMGLAWWTIVSWSPQMLAIAVGRRRYTWECLQHLPEFSLCFPSEELARGAWLCGCESGRDVDKVAKGGFVTRPSTKIRPPIIEGATVAFECRVANRVETGDHDLFIADVVAIHGDPERPKHLYTIHYRRPVAISHDLKVTPDLGLER